MIGKETRNFNQGMNQDVDVRFLQNGQYIDAQNIRVIETDNGRDGAIENVKSNTVKQTVSAGTTYTMPNGINRCIGSIEDEINARTFWFVWNSEGNHLILYYERTSDNIFELLKDNDYATTSVFSPTATYTTGEIVESSANSGVYSECKVDVDLNVFAGNSAFLNTYLFEPVGNYLDFKENSLIQSRIIYKDGETLLFWTDDYNEEGNERVRYVNVDKYINGEYPTNPKKIYFNVAMPAPNHRPTTVSFYDSNVNTNNLIGKFFQFKYRYIGIDGQPSSWSPYSAINIYSYNSRTFGLENNITIGVSRLDGLTTTICKEIEIAAKECGDGNSGDWYIIKRISTDESFSTHGTTGGGSEYGVDFGSEEDPHYYEYTFYNNGDWLAINLDEANYDYSFVPQAAKSLEVVNDNRLTLANTIIGYDTSDLNLSITLDYDGTTYSHSADVATAYSKTFKKGANYDVGIRYSDRQGRTTTVLWDDGLTLNTPYTDDAGTTFINRILPEIDISHQPPTWAYSWQIVIRPANNIAYNGSTPWFVQTGLVATTTLANYDSIYGAGNYSLNSIGMMQTYQIDYINNLNLNYSTTRTDRLRLYMDVDSGTGAGQDPTTLIDRQIFDLQTISGENYIGSRGPSTEISLYSVVELYKTQNTRSSIWYEIGDSKKCGYDVNGAWSHLSKTLLTVGLTTLDTDQVVGTTAAKTFIFDSDCYLGYIEMYDTGTWPPTTSTSRGLITANSSVVASGSGFMETAWIDPDYNSRSNDRGRPNALERPLGGAYRSSRYTTEGRLQFSQPIVQETNRVDFSLMYDGDIVDNNVQFGDINLIHQQSSNLYILQDNKISYRPVARTIIEDLESQQLVGISGNVLGDANYLPYEYGCSNPESFATYKGIMYFADINNQAVLAMSGTNVDDISKNGMKVYFDSAFNAAKYYNTAPYIYGGIDKEFSEYVLAFNYESIYTTLINQSYSSGIFSSDRTSNEMFELISLDQENAALPSSFSKRRAVRYIDSVSGAYAEAEGTISAEVGSGSPSIEGLGNGLNITTGGDPTTNAMIVGSMDTISFNTNVGVWATRYSFNPDGMCSSGVKLCSFKDGKFYLHNDSDEATFNTFYGTQYASKLKFAFNAINGQKKVYNTIGINADTVWTGVLTNYSGQETSILSTDWESLDGIYWSPVYRDSNTPNVSNPETQGDLLVDDHLMVELSQTSSTLTNLYNSTGMFNISNTQVING